jgi:hypothetical protein
LFILFYHSKISEGKEIKEKEKITQLKKAKDKRRHGCWLALILPWPPNTRDPSKAHQNLLQRQETLEKTHSLSTIYCAESLREMASR